MHCYSVEGLPKAILSTCVQAVAIQRLDDTESRALAERQAKDRAAELSEQAWYRRYQGVRQLDMAYISNMVCCLYYICSLTIIV